MSTVEQYFPHTADGYGLWIPGNGLQPGPEGVSTRSFGFINHWKLFSSTKSIRERRVADKAFATGICVADDGGSCSGIEMNREMNREMSSETSSDMNHSLPATRCENSVGRADHSRQNGKRNGDKTGTGTAAKAGHPPTRTKGPVVVALGGNAIGNQTSPGTIADLQAVSAAMSQTAVNGLVITHGNGPQVGYLNAMQPAATQQTLDVLGAETEGWLGYAIEQAIAEHLPESRESVSVLTRMQVDRDDPALRTASKPIGQWYSHSEARQLQAEHGWQFRQQGERFRRMVPSPTPLRCLQIRSIRALLAAGSVVICAGGGGIPVVKDRAGKYTGLEAVIDKDLASALLAEQLDAALLVLATDVDGVYAHWPAPGVDNRSQTANMDRPAQKPLSQATPEQLQELDLEAGSMAPKVAAASKFARKTGRPAMIGHLNNLDLLLQQTGGTRIVNHLNANGLRRTATGA